MVIDPLRDVRLRGHGALIERHLRRELQMLILAMIGSRQSAYRQYDLDETHWQVSIRNQSRRRGTKRPRLLPRCTEYFTFSQHRHVAGEPPQRNTKGSSGRSALRFDEGRQQPHGHKVV